MKVLRNLLLVAVGLLAATTLAEEMKFQYSLPGNQNICFLQNIAENIQGTVHLDNQTQ